MFLETSQDIFYIVLSLAVVWFTVFLCWLLYQAARFLRNANDIVENVNKKINLIADAVEFMRDRVDKATGHMGTVSKMISKIVEKFIFGKLAEKIGNKLSGDDKKENKDSESNQEEQKD